jgi:hypothetical protein
MSDGAVRIATHASASPAAPPISASIRLSVSSCVTILARVPPIAARTAISRDRPSARASRRFATFAQAISRTKPTTPVSTNEVVFNSPPTIASRSGAIVTPQPLLLSGHASARRLAMPVMSAFACSIVTPGFSRAITCK